jgi:Polyketide cyclase / dehydrase and lipid transport
VTSDPAAALRFSDSVVVARPPEDVYALVSDVTRTGEWSPTCAACWWDEGAGPRPGSWFTGRNVTPQRTWETRSQVVAADPGREFTWVVGDGLVRWSYLLEPRDGGTLLTETWDFLPAGLAFFAEKYGEDAAAQVEERRRSAYDGIPRTLAALKAVAEAG